jgi:hypothetical protein
MEQVFYPEGVEPTKAEYVDRTPTEEQVKQLEELAKSLPEPVDYMEVIGLVNKEMPHVFTQDEVVGHLNRLQSEMHPPKVEEVINPPEA